jgi:hypothetical protein
MNHFYADNYNKRPMSKHIMNGATLNKKINLNEQYNSKCD